MKKWKKVKLAEITTNLDNKRKPLNSQERKAKEGNGTYAYLGANNIVGWIDEYIFDEKILCIAEDGGSWGYKEKCSYIYNGKCWVNNHAHVLVENGKCILEFLHYYLNYSDFSNVITGTTRGKLTKSALNSIKIPLPPLPIQKQIAELLDTADALRRNTQTQIDQLDALAQSVFLEMFGDPVFNHKKWEKASLKDCCTKIGSGATPRGGKEAYKSEGISLIRSMNVYDQKFKYKNLAFIDDEQAKKLNNVSVEKNDVLFNITGASVCRCTVVPEDILPARVNQHVAILRPKRDSFNSKFLNFSLTSKNSKIELLGVGSNGATTREAITKDDLEKFKIPVPPLALQIQFASIIENIESQKSVLTRSLRESEDVFGGLLQEVFG